MFINLTVAALESMFGERILTSVLEHRLFSFYSHFCLLSYLYGNLHYRGCITSLVRSCTLSYLVGWPGEHGKDITNSP